jgi:ATP/ADP translocase
MPLILRKKYSKMVANRYFVRDSFAQLSPSDNTLLLIRSSASASSSWLSSLRGGGDGADDDTSMILMNESANPYDAIITSTGNSTTTSAIISSLLLSGGGNGDGDEEGSWWAMTPQAKSVLCMSMAMACHYLGYSLARSISVSLFTSDRTGFPNSRAAFPLAMTCISPVSLVMLVWYGSILDQYGAKMALVYSTLSCAVVIQCCAMIIYYGGGLHNHNYYPWLQRLLQQPSLVRAATGFLFVFRESYVQLLTSQYWSFLASALSPLQSARWFGPIAGLTSITSTFAGLVVSSLVRAVGLTGALMGTSVMLLLSLWPVSMAYGLAREHGFEPKPRPPQKKKNRAEAVWSTLRKQKPQKMVEESQHGPKSLWIKAQNLFHRVPVLSALFYEILASQGLSTLLNLCFVSCLGQAIPDDEQRAGYVGRYYSLINIITMILQFAVLPPLMTTILEPKMLWRVLPLVPLLCTTYQIYQNTDHPSLYIVSAALLVMKVSEYSVRRLLDEMIYVPLDYESRYLGKEVLGVFGYRLGKSLMSLAISVYGALDPSFGLRKQGILSHIVCLVWVKTAWRLSTMVPTRAEAEQAHQRNK